MVEQSGLSDPELEKLFGITQSTLWRAKNGRIAKLGRYISCLQQHVAGAQLDGERVMVEDLLHLSHFSPEVRHILESLHSLMQKNA